MLNYIQVKYHQALTALWMFLRYLAISALPVLTAVSNFSFIFMSTSEYTLTSHPPSTSYSLITVSTISPFVLSLMIGLSGSETAMTQIRLSTLTVYRT